METFTITIAGKTYKVEIGEVSSSPITVRVNGQLYSVEWQRERAGSEPMPIASTAASAPPKAAPEPPKRTSIAPTGSGKLVEVTAPMPGKILQVNVQAGDQVRYGQQVCSLEAMKMESAIQSTAEGTVVSVNVSVGQSVQYGDVLVVIEKQGE